MRLFGRSRRPRTQAAVVPPTDPDLVRWVDTARTVSTRLGVGGRLAVALLGESLLRDEPAPWFGYEPTAQGAADLLAALGEEPASLEPLLAVEHGMVSRRLGSMPSDVRAHWRDTVAAAAAEARASWDAPPRTPEHLEAEAVWREAASAIQGGRAVRLQPDRALVQLRWYPGCATRTHIGYADPLDLATVQRAVQEHRWTQSEWDAVDRASAAASVAVDPVGWRLSAMTFAVQDGRWHAS